MSARKNLLLRADRPDAKAMLSAVMARLGAPLCAQLEETIGLHAEAKTDALVLQDYGEWEGCDWPGCAFGSDSVMSVAIAIAPALPAALIEQRYGGSGVGLAANRPIGRAGAALAQTVAEAAAKALGHVLPALAQAGSLGFQAQMSRGGFARHDDSVAVSAINLCFDGGLEGRIAFAFAPNTIQTTPATTTPEADAAQWQQQLAASMLETRMSVRAVLARPELSAAAVAGLAVGDVMPIAKPAQLPLLIGAHRFGMGTLDECDGQAAIRINAMETCHE